MAGGHGAARDENHVGVIGIEGLHRGAGVAAEGLFESRAAFSVDFGHPPHRLVDLEQAVTVRPGTGASRPRLDTEQVVQQRPGAVLGPVADLVAGLALAEHRLAGLDHPVTIGIDADRARRRRKARIEHGHLAADQLRDVAGLLELAGAVGSAD